MNIQKLREVITQYLSLDANDDFATEKCWKEMTAMLSENIDRKSSAFYPLLYALIHKARY